MKTLRFKVGDLARVVNSCFPERIGLTCEIVGIHVFSTHGELRDYAIVYPGGEVPPHPTDFHWVTNDSYLAPLPGDSREDFLPPAVRSIFNVTPNQGLPVGPRPRVKA